MRGFEIAIAGVSVGQRIGVEGDDSVQSKTVDRLLVISGNAAHIGLDDGAAGRVAIADGLLGFSNRGADDIKGRARLRTRNIGVDTESQKRKGDCSVDGHGVFMVIAR